MSRHLTIAAAVAATVLAACGGSTPLTAVASPTSAATMATVTATRAAAAEPNAVATTGAPGGADQRAALQAWRDCLTQRGVTLPSVPQGGRRNGGTGTTTAGTTDARPAEAAPAPDGQGGPGGAGGFGQVLQDPANQDAVTACASLQPQGGFGGPNGGAGGTDGGPRGQASQPYFSCLRDHGVSVPTTVAGGPPPSIDRTGAEFAAAQETCRVLLPQRAQGGDEATTSTTAGA
jgi:hypothetical protein